MVTCYHPHRNDVDMCQLHAALAAEQARSARLTEALEVFGQWSCATCDQVISEDDAEESGCDSCVDARDRYREALADAPTGRYVTPEQVEAIRDVVDTLNRAIDHIAYNGGVNRVNLRTSRTATSLATLAPLLDAPSKGSHT